MSIIYTFVNSLNIKLLDCKDIIKYKNGYQITFNKIFNFFNKDL